MSSWRGKTVTLNADICANINVSVVSHVSITTVLCLKRVVTLTEVDVSQHGNT